MELTLDFDRPISVLKAREMARKLIDRFDIEIDGLEVPEEFGEATLKCSDLQRVIHIRMNPPDSER